MSSVLFFFLGLVILYRSIAETGLYLGMGVGALFLGYGVFRLRYIWRYFFPKSEKA